MRANLFQMQIGISEVTHKNNVSFMGKIFFS